MQWCCCSQRDSAAGAALAQSVPLRGKGAPCCWEMCHPGQHHSGELDSGALPSLCDLRCCVWLTSMSEVLPPAGAGSRKRCDGRLRKAAWAPLSVSSSRVCCWLFSKYIKATDEISLVSLRNSLLEGFYSRGPYIMQGWSIISGLFVVFFPQILLFSLMFRQEQEVFASCLIRNLF